MGCPVPEPKIADGPRSPRSRRDANNTINDRAPNVLFWHWLSALRERRSLRIRTALRRDQRSRERTCEGSASFSKFPSQSPQFPSVHRPRNVCNWRAAIPGRGYAQTVNICIDNLNSSAMGLRCSACPCPFLHQLSDVHSPSPRFHRVPLR